MKKEHKPPVTSTDRLCIAAVLALWFGLATVGAVLDDQSIRAAQVDKPTAAAVQATELAPLAEVLEERREELFWRDIPLDQECRTALVEACAAYNVPLCDALGLIEVESGFEPEAVNGVCYGLCQLNSRWFPSDLSPAENIRAGIGYLGELLERYEGDELQALTAYNQGKYKGAVSQYARNVLAASEKWGVG